MRELFKYTARLGRSLSTGNNLFPSVCLIFTLTLISTTSFAEDSPQSFVYQGRLFSSDGTSPLTDVVDLTIGIVDPSGNCLLYEEVHNNVDLGPTAGIFSVEVGSPIASQKRTSRDSGLAMGKVYSNSGAQIRATGTNCTSGYTPAAGDSRKLRITVTSHSLGIPLTLSPDQAINSQPSSIVAQSLQGLSVPDLIQAASGASGQDNVSLSTLKSLTSGADATTLHHHDSLYVKLGSGLTPTLLGGGIVSTSGQLGIGTSTPGAQIHINTSSWDVKGEIIKGASAQTANLFELQNSLGSILSYFDGSGNLILGNDPVSTMGAVSKQYVDTKFLAGVTSFNARTGTVSLLSSDVTSALGFTPASSLSSLTSLIGDISASGPGSATATVNSVGGVSATNVALGANSANTATNTNTVSTLVKRDTSGNFSAGTISANLIGNVTGNLTGAASSNILRAGDAMTGYLSLSADPTVSTHAATKNYVDFKTDNSVQSFNTRTGAVTLTAIDISTALSFNPQPAGNYLSTLSGDVSASAPGTGSTVNSIGGISAAIVALGTTAANSATSASTSGSIVKRDASGNFSAGTISAALSGNASTATTAATAGTATSFSGALTGDVTGNQGSTAIATVGGVTAANVALGANAANAGTSTATNSAIVRRDASGNFAAGVITAALTGHASADISKAGDTMTGFLSLNADPTALLQAATKNYVDFKASTSGVTTFNTRTGAVSLSFADVTTALAFDPANIAGDTFTGFVTLNANPTANLHAATKNYVDLATAIKQATGNYLTALTGDISASGPGSAAGTVNTVGGVTAANVALGANAANAATSSNNANAIVRRDASGNFTAATITATGGLTGHASLDIAKTGDTMTGALGFSSVVGDKIALWGNSSAAHYGLGIQADVMQLHSDTSGTDIAFGYGSSASFSENMRVKGNGNVGIGTTTPQATLDVAGTIRGTLTGASSLNVLKAGDTMTGGLSISDGGLTTSGSLAIATNLLTASTSNGTVGVGVALGGAKLHVLPSNAGTTATIIQGAASQSADLLQLQNNGGTVLSKFDSTGDLTLPSNGLVVGTSQLVVSGGNVGIGTTTPRADLDVNGTVVSRAAVLNGTSTVNFSVGNVHYTTASCGAFSLQNMVNGGSYMFVVQGSTAATCTFTPYSDAGVTALTLHPPPGYGATTASQDTIFNFVVVGTDVYMSWNPGM